MNDDVKGDLMQRSREWLQSCVSAATRSGVPEEADLEAFILVHIDGEQARQDAAVAAAREEQREADARFIRSDEATWDSAHELDEVIRTSPLTATPLADRIAELEAENDGATAAGRKIADRWVDEKDRADYATAALRLHGFRECDIAACNCGSWHAPPNLRAEKAEAERDRLAVDALAALAGAGVATPQEGYTAAPFLLKGDIGRLAAERDALRAQVEAARALCADFDRGGGLMWPGEVLAAMESAMESKR